jgi:macrolide-specific efflux system membrane fusion protein
MEQTPEFVKSGMTANVSFILTGRTNVLLLPADAVAPDDTVELPPTHPGEKPGHHQIKTGMSDGQWVEVTAGLEEGQLVLRESYALPPEKTTTGFSLLPRMSSRTNTPPTRP